MSPTGYPGYTTRTLPIESRPATAVPSHWTVHDKTIARDLRRTSGSAQILGSPLSRTRRVCLTRGPRDLRASGISSEVSRDRFIVPSIGRATAVAGLRSMWARSGVG